MSTILDKASSPIRETSIFVDGLVDWRAVFMNGHGNTHGLTKKPTKIDISRVSFETSRNAE